jgi:hypothetical protein
MSANESVLQVVNEQDAHNFEGSRRSLGHMAALPEDVAKLYTIHHEAALPMLTPGPAPYAFGLYAACRKHLVLGAVSLFRLYSAQMARETRAAVEAAGIAYAIQTDPESFRVFKADDGRDEGARKNARRHFTSNRLFPSQVPKLESLKTFYDLNSNLSHTNWLTFVRQVDTTATPGQFGYSYQDLKKDRLPRDLPKFLVWLCMAHVAILLAADDVFANLAVDAGPFQSEREYVFEKLRRFDAQHKAQFPSEAQADL